jgi:hypothetical protein
MEVSELWLGDEISRLGMSRRRKVWFGRSESGITCSFEDPVSVDRILICRGRRVLRTKSTIDNFPKTTSCR